MKQKLFIAISIFLLALLCFSGKTKAATVTPSKTTIYAMGERAAEVYKEKIKSIPANIPQSYTIKVTGNKETPKFEVEGEAGKEAIEVDQNGKVTPKTHTVSYSNYGVYKEYDFGTYKVKITVDGQTLYSEVTLESYPQYYAESIMDKYLKENIKPGMSGREKLVKICEFICSYDYSASASSYTSMILTGGGDCWASTSTVVYMCNKIGIEAYSRFAANDPGAGNGHRNAMAFVDGKYYMVEAGYNEKAPRMYSISETYPWTYRVKEDGTLRLTQYDGKETNIIVPEKLRNKNSYRNRRIYILLCQ